MEHNCETEQCREHSRSKRHRLRTRTTGNATDGIDNPHRRCRETTRLIFICLLVPVSSRLTESKENTCTNARPGNRDCEGVILRYPLLARRPLFLDLVVDRICLR